MAAQIKVLVVDDEEIVLKSMRRILKGDDEHEFLVDTASSGADGLALVKGTRFDIIITDLMMPELDGLQFIDGVRRSYPNILIVMITGYATMKTALKALRKGAFDYIAKPFTIEELRSVMTSAARAALMLKAGEMKAPGDRAPEKAETHCAFFNQTYASVQRDGTLLFGVEEGFVSLVGKPISLELANVGEVVTQGFPFGSITNSRMKVHKLRAPFSGIVLGVNDKAVGDASLIQSDPGGKGWLLHVSPADFETEIKNLGS